MNDSFERFYNLLNELGIAHSIFVSLPLELKLHQSQNIQRL